MEAVMFENQVEERLKSFLGGVESRVRSYLDLCTSASSRLLLLEFLSLPGVHTTARGGALASRPTDRLEVPGGAASGHAYPGTKLPPGLVWLDWWLRLKVFDDEKSQCCRLIPKFRVTDEETGESASTVDFALFWPRVDGKGHLKIAIDCNGGPGDKAGGYGEKYQKLEEHGWIVVHLPESEVCKDPARTVEQINDVVMEANARFVQERRCGH